MNSLVSRRLIVRPWFVLVAGISGGSISKRVLGRGATAPFRSRASETSLAGMEAAERPARQADL